MTIQANIHLDPTQIIGEVHDYLYGANLEHIGQSIYGGIWAEMLRDRKFAGHDIMYTGASEGLHNIHPDFGIVAPWEAVNANYDNVLFVPDRSTFYTGEQSQRITIRRADNQAHGIQQRGLYLQTSLGYDIRIVLKGEGQTVRIQLGDSTWIIEDVSDNWTTYKTTLTPEKTSTNSAFSITISTESSLWIGCASVMPSNSIHGFRPDVIEALKEWSPTFLRWPGGNFVSGYHWEDGIGDRDKRPSYLDPAWSLWESNDVGTDEFMTLCEILDCDPVLTINMGNGTVQEAVNWLVYCNKGVDWEYGAIRTTNGHADPYNLRTWFVGNEQFGNWQVGHIDAETYAKKYLEFACAMREVDDNLELIAVGVPIDLYGHWNELVLKNASHEIDQLSVHFYSIRTEKMDNPPSPEHLYLPKIAASYEVAQMLDDTLDIMGRCSDRKIPLAFDEWNTYCGAKSPNFIEDYNLADALYAGALMNACIQRADRIKVGAIFNLINVMGSYLVSPQYKWEAINLGRGGAWVPMAIDETFPEPSTVKVPPTLVLELMTKYRGEQAILCEVESPVYTSLGAGNQPSFEDVPIIDAAATYDKVNNLCYLSIVNRSVETTVQISLAGLDQGEIIKTFRVSSNHPMDTNTFENPITVQISEQTIINSHNEVTIAPHTFSLLIIQN